MKQKTVFKTKYNQSSRKKIISILSITSLLAVGAALSSQFPILQNLSNRIFKKYNSRFQLQNIEWKDQNHGNLSYKVTSDSLWKASGLKKGDPLFEIDLDDLEKRLLKIPYIETVQIQKHLSMGLAIQYKTYQARAVFVKNQKPWLVSASSKWIAPVEGGNSYPLDIPFLTGFESVDTGLEWLKEIESDLLSDGLQNKIQVHEINKVGHDIFALLQFGYSFQSLKVTCIFSDPEKSNDPDMQKSLSLEKEKQFERLKKVVRYLIKNNILVSRIDLRAGQKIVVNVGKRL